MDTDMDNARDRDSDKDTDIDRGTHKDTYRVRDTDMNIDKERIQTCTRTWTQTDKDMGTDRERDNGHEPHRNYAEGSNAPHKCIQRSMIHGRNLFKGL